MGSLVVAISSYADGICEFEQVLPKYADRLLSNLISTRLLEA